MAKDFFGVMEDYDPTKELVDLAMKKFTVDMEKQKFDAQMKKVNMELEEGAKAIEGRNKAREYLTGLMTPKTIPGVIGNPDADTGLEAFTSMPREEIPRVSARDLIFNLTKMGALTPEESVKNLISLDSKGEWKFIGNQKNGISAGNPLTGEVVDVSKPEGTNKFANMTKEQLTAMKLFGSPEEKQYAEGILKDLSDQKMKEESGGIAPAKPGDTSGGLDPNYDRSKALEGLSTGDANIVKAISQYRYQLPTGYALTKPYWRNIMGRVAMYDPSFDGTQYGVRANLRKDFTSGKSAQNIRSLNTAISHLETLQKAGDELSNTKYPIWNEIANKTLSGVGDPRVTKFNTAATAVESELAALFKNMGATDQEIKAWRTNLNAAQSPAQMQAAIETAWELMGGRMSALENQYLTGLGKPKDFKFLSKKSEDILKKMNLWSDEVDKTVAEDGKPGYRVYYDPTTDGGKSREQLISEFSADGTPKEDAEKIADDIIRMRSKATGAKSQSSTAGATGTWEQYKKNKGIK